MPTRRAFLAAAAGSLVGTRAASPAPNTDLVARLGKLLCPGDAVFRSGLSLESGAVLAARARSRFSHVGIAAVSGSELHIVHALPPERGYAGGVVNTSWANYAAASDVEAVGVFRVAHASTGERTRIADGALRFLGTPFNSAFSLDRRDGVYCTQLALSALSCADPAITRAVLPTPVAFLPQPVYLPDSLLNWPRLVEVKA